MFFIICAIDLCEVFHSAKLLLSILVGAQKFHLQMAINFVLNSINKLISYKL
jgi:hypothetical protein